MTRTSRFVLIAVILAVAIGPVFFTGVAVQDLGPEFWQSSFGSARGWTNTLRELTPMLIAGLAVFIALRAGLFNIGAEGQLLMGARAGIAVTMTTPGPLGVFLGVIAGSVAGALWALPAAAIKVWRGGHEVISTIMLNQIAFRLTGWLVKNPMKDPKNMAASTANLPESSWLPPLLTVDNASLSWAVPLGIALIGLTWYWLGRRVTGFELLATGANPSAARFAGVEVNNVTMRAMAMSGGLSGLAGVLMVLGDQHRFYEGFSAGKGFDALGVALLAGTSAWMLVPMALIFSGLAAGTTGMSLIGVPKGLSSLLFGGLILVFAAMRKQEHSGD